MHKVHIGATFVLPAALRATCALPAALCATFVLSAALGATFVLSAALCATALAATVTAAAPEQHRWHRGDAKMPDIKIADMEAKAAAVFDKIDTNHDGAISAAEFDAMPPMGGMARMRGMHRMHPMGDRMGGGMGDRMGGGMGDRMGGMGGGGAMGSDHPPPPDFDAPAPQGAEGHPHRPDPKVALPALFKRLDANNDGRLSADEFAKLPDARRAQMREHMFRMLDKDGNGSLSREEFPPFVARLKALDKNGNGVVTRDELPRHGRRSHGPGAGNGPPNGSPNGAP